MRRSFRMQACFVLLVVLALPSAGMADSECPVGDFVGKYEREISEEQSRAMQAGLNPKIFPWETVEILDDRIIVDEGSFVLEECEVKDKKIFLKKYLGRVILDFEDPELVKASHVVLASDPSIGYLRKVKKFSHEKR